jgi:hypothetical protein
LGQGDELVADGIVRVALGAAGGDPVGDVALVREAGEGEVV